MTDHQNMQGLETRRDFLPNFTLGTVGALSLPSLLLSLMSCSDAEERIDEGYKPPERFAFLARDGDLAFQRLREGRGMVSLPTEPVTFVATREIPLFHVPDDLSAGFSRRFPTHRTVRAERTERACPETNARVAQSYKAYAKDIISFAREHPALAHCQHPKLEVLLVGEEVEDKTAIPFRINAFRVDDYVLHGQHKTDLKHVASAEARILGAGAIASGLIELVSSGSDPDNVRLVHDPQNFSANLSTWGNKSIGLFLAPLSEYTPFVLRRGIVKHFDAYRASLGGKIARKDMRRVEKNLLVAMEAVSETASAQILLDYIAHFGLEKQLPPHFTRDLGNYVKNGILFDDPSNTYGFVPTAFSWNEAEGLSSVTRAYTGNNALFMQKMREFKSKK